MENELDEWDEHYEWVSAQSERIHDLMQHREQYEEDN